ncbi:hypothetical protein D2A34_21945 [Clostridium chromiireducens]|uniref:Phage tail fibre protein N-terminal domain-containing protein n=1 Tax=Clostridium chromiireducens TaxID=225345 RepID=A0A399IIS2_9CLOT|nr:phage tail protein [Clostridium chromiireducens]RII32860.1 hypothetical protein D2A34_21945 [Clostridium chromiireducens]
MSFLAISFTNKGKSLQAKALTGVQLKFTRIAVGDGSLSNGQDTSNLASLIHEVKSIPITTLKTMTGGKATVGGILSNKDITTGFYFREIGLFALDPDQGEILYSYGNAGALAEYIPPLGGAEIVTKKINLNTIVGNASNVTAAIDQTIVYASPEDVASALSQANLYTDSKVNSKSASDMKITSIAATNILSYTPAQQGNFKIDVYLRVLAAANIIVSVNYTDSTGVQTKIMLSERNGLYFPCSSGIQSYAIGVYYLKSLLINAVKNTPITISITSNVANQVYASALIMGV